MRLKTKLVLSAMAVTFAMVLVLSLLYLGELLRQRIAQTADDNDVLAHEVLSMTRQAVETGLRYAPPADPSEQSVHKAVVDALRSYDPLTDTMNAILRYAPTVQDVAVTDAHGLTLVSTDPDALDQPAMARISLKSVQDGNVWYQAKQMFGKAQVLDVAVPLDRNGMPFLVAHVGVRSSFLAAVYKPWLNGGLWSALVAALLSMAAAALLANAALQPITRISEQLERLTRGGQEEEQAVPQLRDPRRDGDAVVRVTRTIDLLDKQIRSTEAEYTALQTNLNQMLDTLRDGVVLFTADRRATMVSDAIAHFIDRHGDVLVGKRLEEIFDLDTALGAAVLMAFLNEQPGGAEAETVTLEDGRRIQISVDRIVDEKTKSDVGTLLTLRDTESAIKLEQELEVSRRLVAIGRLTAGVGHEVKNPINAMVLHLELLRSKLAGAGSEAERHVDILAGEMQRLDRVVQTLADFTRPMDLHLGEYELRKVVSAVVELTGEEMAENGVQVEFKAPSSQLMVRVDADLIRQALLNLLLNAMQAMPRGGVIRVELSREGRNAVVEIVDEGEGIPAELMPRIFELYFTTKAAGSGIGLAMTYRILQMHGGALEVRSSTDASSSVRGTTFTLRLPIAVTATGGDAREGSRAILHGMELERRS